MHLLHFSYGYRAILDNTSTSMQNFAVPLVIFYSSTIDHSISYVGYVYQIFYILMFISLEQKKQYSLIYCISVPVVNLNVERKSTSKPKVGVYSLQEKILSGVFTTVKLTSERYTTLVLYV